MTARSCEETTKESEEMMSLRAPLQTPEQQLLMGPKDRRADREAEEGLRSHLRRDFSGASRSAQDLKISRRSDPKSNLIHPNFCLN